MIGTILNNRYELIEKIGEGGMAQVYKAKCHKLNRYDAVKILKKEYANDPDVVEKFKREATAIANLSDNNIINIFDVGTQGDIHYIVMEYVKGKTLKEIILQNFRLSYERAIDIAVQISRALDCAHKNNIIHRDVKPQNILLTEDGVVKVTDFGIAKTSSSITITNSNKVIGSAHYFSPEQAKGNYVDGRTDIYSLGIVLYEMVTGKVPFDAESPVTIAIKHIQDTPVPPRQINSSIPENLNKLIMKAVEKDPNNRYQTIRELLNDLLRIQKDINYDITPTSVDKDYTKVMEAVNIADSAKYDDDDGKMNRSTKKVLIIILAAVLTLALGAVAAFLVAGGPGGQNGNDIQGDKGKVPDVVMKTEEVAKTAITDAGFVYRLESEENAEVPIGSVIRTDPEAGAERAAGFKVTIYISVGPGKDKVPSVVDYDISQAEITLTNAGFVLGTQDKEFSETVPENTVIGQTPEADTQAEKGSKINVVISLGRKNTNVKVPKLTGLNLQQADTELIKLKLKLGNKTSVENYELDMAGKISSSGVEEGIEVSEGTAINVQYFDDVKVPNFTTMTLQDVEQHPLVKNGVITIVYPEEAKEYKDLKIVAQDVEANKVLSQSVVINLTPEEIPET